MSARSIALVTALSLATGCGGHQSTYVRQAASPGELVWRYDEHLQVTQNGKVVAEANDWRGLADAVSCVPSARDWAAEASARHRTGTRTLWSGVIGGTAGFTAGTIVFFTSFNDHEDRALVGLLTALGSIVFMAIAGPVGSHKRASAGARGIDAVNLYNDKLAAGACPSVSSPPVSPLPPSALPKLTAPPQPAQLQPAQPQSAPAQSAPAQPKSAQPVPAPKP